MAAIIITIFLVEFMSCNFYFFLFLLYHAAWIN